MHCTTSSKSFAAFIPQGFSILKYNPKLAVFSCIFLVPFNISEVPIYMERDRLLLNLCFRVEFFDFRVSA
jgi:hypothetical protein